MLTLLLTLSIVAPPVWESIPEKTINPGYEAIFGEPGKRVDKTRCGLVAVLPSDWVELEKYGAAGDDDGLTEMLKRRRVFAPELGSTLKVITYGKKTQLVEVRVTSGSCKGKRGYIPAKYLCVEVVPRG